MAELRTEPNDPTRAATGPSRRAVLQVTAAAGPLSALLVACGGSEDSTTATDSGTSGSGSEDSTTSGSADAGGALTPTSDVPVGGGVILEDRKVVVTQPAQGTFKAFTAVCTHQQCLVTSVKNDRISCPCHGSVYSAQDGSVISGPAPRPLKEIAVTVEGDQVVES